MKALRYSRRVWLAVLVCLLPVAGCKSKVPLAPVSGKVMVGDQPVTAGQVALVPEKGVATAGLCAGRIEPDGTYTIATDGRSGAPVGKYKVTVTPSMVPTGSGPPPAPFNAAYQSARTTTLAIEVVSAPPAGAYDLKLQK
jgi:hypothetical protein